jgi:hypothetical protein
LFTKPQDRYIKNINLLPSIILEDILFFYKVGGEPERWESGVGGERESSLIYSYFNGNKQKNNHIFLVSIGYHKSR